MNFLDIPIRTSTGAIPFRLSADCKQTDVEEISRIFSIPPEPADLSIRTAILLSNPPPDAVASRIRTHIPIFQIYRMKDETIGLYPEDDDDINIARTWRGVLLFAMLYSILRGNSHCFLHGSVLQHSDDTVTILFGESGIGKSTTAKRYAAAGGKVICDDQMLLHLHENGNITVSALPTWSRIKASLIGMNETYDVQTEYQIRRFCRLSRDPQREYLDMNSKRDFQVRLLKELVMHTYKMLNFLPVQTRTIFGPHFMRFMDAITKQWPMETLYANLNASLTETISID